MRPQLGTVMLALGASVGSLAVAQTCTPTAITPYINVNGTWMQTASATIKTGASAILGPQPVTGGMWSWSGCGTAGGSREQTITPSAACTATATYTNACGAKSTQAFTIKVGTWASAKFGGGGYVTGLVGVWGVYRSDDGGATWTRHNDDAHQYAGVGVMAADQNAYGRIYVGGSCRGVLYSN